MREHDEVQTIVIERGGSGQLGSFVLGALVGAGLALLFAPKSGAETQEDLKVRARDLKATAEARVREAQRQLDARMEAARDGVQARVDGVREAVDAGRRAASDAREDLERKLERSKAAYRAGMEAARKVAATVDPDDADEEGA